MTPNVGIALPNMGSIAFEALNVWPAEFEALGYTSLWVTDHVVGVREYRRVYPPEWAEPIVALTHVAARTTTARVGTGVLVVPYRDPVLLAKALSTLDHLSQGRLVVGVGTGWARGEYHVLGRAELFERRGAATDEALALIIRCWQGGTINWDGEMFARAEFEFLPPPLQSPRPPIWVGGQSARALRRCATFGDVWHPHDISPSEVEQLGRRLDDLAGRAISRSVRIHLTDVDGARDRELLEAYGRAGCTDVVVEFRDVDQGEVRSLATRFAELIQ